MSPDHGDRRRYWRGCRCPACSTAQRRYMKTWRADVGLHRTPDGQAIANPRMVDAAPVAAHLRELVASGWTRSQIAREAGVWHSLLTRLGSGECQRVYRRHADALLSLPPLAPVEADRVVVERLLRREMPWTDANLSERKAACARAFAAGWEDAYVYAQDFLRLRSDAIKAIRADLDSWLAVAS